MFFRRTMTYFYKLRYTQVALGNYSEVTIHILRFKTLGYWEEEEAGTRDGVCNTGMECTSKIWFFATSSRRSAGNSLFIDSHEEGSSCLHPPGPLSLSPSWRTRMSSQPPSLVSLLAIYVLIHCFRTMRDIPHTSHQEALLHRSSSFCLPISLWSLFLTFFWLWFTSFADWSWTRHWVIN